MILRGSKRDSLIRRGAAATEFAMALPFLVLATTAAVDFARVYHATQVLEHSAATAALVASGAAQSSGDLQTAVVKAACDSGVSLPILIDRVSMNSAANVTTVTVGYDFVPITPIHGIVGPLKLSRTVSYPTALRPGE